MSRRVLIINGPGLDDLADPIGDSNLVLTLDSIKDACVKRCADLDVELDFRQTDDHQLLLQWLGDDGEDFDGVVINPVHLPDADSDTDQFYDSAMQLVAQLKKPAIEVRLSNIYKRDARISRPLHKPKCDMGFVSGFGLQGYLLAINSMAQRISTDA